ncbi:MAG: Ig-like domain-containing protein [Planctomycetota bacterium]|nr:Ig-like domain-containing protein [Planctomycetota bacterium]
MSTTRLFSLAALVALTSCGGGSSGAGGNNTGGDFVVLSTEPSDNGQLFLNDPIRIDFSNPVDLGSVDLTTFGFQVFDQVGTPIAEPVAGEFMLGTSPGDSAPGRRLMFVPVLPTNNLYTNGGFRPGRTYQVQLVGGNVNNGTVILDQSGQGLTLPRTFSFATADGTTPSALFRNTAPGGPRRAAFEVSPTPDTDGVVLNKLGAAPVELRLRFDQPLNPSSANIPTEVETDPLTRNSNSRGRVFLEYDDPDFGDNWWIPAEVELESNSSDGATLLLRPIGVLPNNATVRVVVENTLEDISGESNVANVAYERVFATFQTRRDYEQQFDGLVDDFLATSQVDLTAAFSEPVGEVGPGYLKAGFDFEGTVTGAEFEPTAPMTVLNTNFTTVTPKNGSPYNVSGGVFNFRNVNIPAGRTVQGQGTNPMVWLVSENFEVAGTLSVRGGDGQRVNTSGNANVAKEGGAGVCGGGDGGAGSPSALLRDIAGAPGNGPLQAAEQGGRGGTLSCTAGCGRGSGGGGGSLSTQGDPGYKQLIRPAGTVPIGTGNPPPLNPFAIFQQQTGIGGQGCSGPAGTVTRSLEGAVPGPTVFVDARTDNDFWGVGVRYDTSLRITGELSVPIGGGGGGGGGDLSYNSECGVEDPNFENDSSGGGGGGGGGVLIVKALGDIIISDGGRITADGGSGGGGEPSSTSTRGGGGGGGSGGMVILMSAKSIVINAKSGDGQSYSYRDNDYDFAISADGGVCVTGNAPPVVAGKYPASGSAVTEQSTLIYDSSPLGGFGGMGIVQLMVPPGELNSDNTNTVLDDNIRILTGGLEANGQQKIDLLSWRGYPNSFGQGVDDQGQEVNPQGLDEGEIRPRPHLLPTPFGSSSRLRSKWIDTGATARRALSLDDNLPRGIVEQGGALAGPGYEWAGVEEDPASVALGYAKYEISQGRGVTVFPEAVAPAGILTSNANASFQGRLAYRVTLSSAALGATDDRYVQYEAELLDNSGSRLGSYRILSHTANELVLSTESGALEVAATQVRVVQKFFEIITDGLEGLGSTYGGSQSNRVPIANIRFGFAFHQNPQDPAAQRFPAAPGTYAYDLSDPTVQEQIRQLGANFVQWDLLFDTKFRAAVGDSPPDLNPETPRPELHFLRLPFRF